MSWLRRRHPTDCVVVISYQVFLSSPSVSGPPSLKPQHGDAPIAEMGFLVFCVRHNLFFLSPQTCGLGALALRGVHRPSLHLSLLRTSHIGSGMIALLSSRIPTPGENADTQQTARRRQRTRTLRSGLGRSKAAYVCTVEAGAWYLLHSKADTWNHSHSGVCRSWCPPIPSGLLGALLRTSKEIRSHAACAGQLLDLPDHWLWLWCLRCNANDPGWR